MLHVTPNFTTKKALLDAIIYGEHVSVYCPGSDDIFIAGTFVVNGPQNYDPIIHNTQWTAKVVLKNGRIVGTIR